MSREICPDCVNTPCQCFENELKNLSDDMMLSADPLGKIKDLQSRLTAAETRVKELELRRIRLFIVCNKCNVEFEIYFEHNICAGEHRCSHCGTINTLWARAELDKLKGKS